MESYPRLIRSLIAHPDVSFCVIGGSRSRDSADPRSDYDLFVGIHRESFETWISDFSSVILEIEPSTVFSGFDLLKPGWGHLHGVLTEDGVYYDISVIDSTKPEDFCPIETNIILKDDSEALKGRLSRIEDTVHCPITFYRNDVSFFLGRFYIDWFRAHRAINAGNYQLSLRYLNFLRSQTLILWRKINSEFGPVPSIPEKGALGIEFSERMRYAITIDGTLAAINASLTRLAAIVDSFGVDITVLQRIEKAAAN